MTLVGTLCVALSILFGLTALALRERRWTVWGALVLMLVVGVAMLE